jgi:two-component system phosphate regulon sensor histidine kinase PhoR
MTPDAGGNLLPVVLLLALVLFLAIMLAIQLRQRNALRAWLEAPELHTIPDGSGAWRAIFSRLQALRKKERKQHVELGNALERFRQAAQALPDGVILLDDRMHIEWLNAAGCRHFVLDPARDVGTLAGQLIRQSEFQNLMAAYRATPTAQSVLLRRGNNGNERVLSVMLAPFADTGTLLLSTDVTERVRTEIVHRDFIANVSHELRTPLTVITGFLEQFNSAEPPDGKAARTFLGLMAEQTTRMNRLVADLLTLSHLENSDRPARDESVDVLALLAALRTEALALSAGKHEIEIADVSAGKLRGSADELRSAFGNLAFNAVRYTPAGGRITLAWHLTAGAPTFSVTDTGIGIPAEHIPRLTERFYRVDKGRSTASGGTGLGLAIVKHVLARHGGELRIDSIPGKGSTFSARLPADRLL